MTVIVTCAHTRSSLAAVRSLGRLKVPVVVGALRRPALAQWSSLATSTFLLPDPKLTPEAFAFELGQQALGRHAQMILVSTDVALWALSEWRHHLPESLVNQLPTKSSVRCAVDRFELMEQARLLSIAGLPTARINDDEEVEAVVQAAREMGFPLVLITGPSRQEGEEERDKNVFHFKEEAALRSFITENADRIGGSVLQPMISGLSLGYGALYQKGEPVAEVFQKRIREHEPASQFASSSETIEPHLEIQKEARRLLKHLKWSGPVKLEFIETPNGEVKLACMLGRLWGSMQLAVHAGVDVPVLWHRLLLDGQKSTKVQQAKSGIRMRWLMGEVSHLLDTFTFQWVRQRGLRGVPKSAENLWRFWHPRSLKAFGTDVLRWKDPLPFMYEVQKTVRKAVKQKANRVIEESSFVRPLILPKGSEKPPE